MLHCCCFFFSESTHISAFNIKYDLLEHIIILHSDRLNLIRLSCISFIANHLYWCDGVLGRVEVALTNGGSRYLVFSNPAEIYWGLSIDSTYIYLTSWISRY